MALILAILLAARALGADGGGLRRLTHSQYNNVIRDLLGDSSAPADRFPPEDFVNGFKNQYESQSIPPLIAEAYGAAAEKLARNAFRTGALGVKPGQRLEDWIRAFGRRAFRRSLTEAEARRYTGLARPGANAGDGARLAVEAMLQSPHFLFRSDSDPASALSFFLWDSAPDDALLAARDRGELKTPAGLEKVARRMLGDPKARRSVDEFAFEWLRLDRVLTAVKDRREFPMFSLELARAMTEETRQLFADLVWNDANFMRLFSADYSFLSAELAALYNAPAPAADFDRVALPAESERAGVFGQAAFLTLTSKPLETSPTARGLYIREQFLCQPVPQPPPGVNSTLAPVAEDRPQTNRDRLAEHTSNTSCAGCHKLIDPIGYGFEKFDAIGRRREKLKITFLPGRRERERAPRAVELDLDTRGQVAGLPRSAFASPRELGRLLESSPVCQECVVKQLFRYTNGRVETQNDRPVIRRALADFRASGFRFTELMVAVIKYSQFPPPAEE